MIFKWMAYDKDDFNLCGEYPLEVEADSFHHALQKIAPALPNDSKIHSVEVWRNKVRRKKCGPKVHSLTSKASRGLVTPVARSRSLGAMNMKLKAAKTPCGSCPYRRDVPSGIWDISEYDKLPSYDGPTGTQSWAVFMCHQNDGCLCAGWLACHDPRELLALRLSQSSDPSIFDYRTDVPVFASGTEAREHGIREIKRPGVKAAKMIAGLIRKRSTATRSRR